MGEVVKQAVEFGYERIIVADAIFVAKGICFKGKSIEMLELKCGWCGKSDDQVDTLITGSDARICNLCVDVCKLAIAENTSSAIPETKRPKCSFCELDPWTHKLRLTSGNGAHICQTCLDACDEILDDAFWMSKLTCGWCGKNKSEAYKLVVNQSKDTCICNECLADCKRTSDENSSSASPSIGKPICSFCIQDSDTEQRRPMATKEIKICRECLERCDDILQNDAYFGKAILRDYGYNSNTVQEKSKASPPRKAANLSEIEQQWTQLVYEAADKKQLFKRGAAWSRKNKTDQAAGEAVAHLLEIKSTASIVSIAESWLILYPCHKDVPLVLGALIKTAQSSKSVRHAGQYIQTLSNLKNSDPIIKAAIESQNPSLSKRIEQAMEKYPTGWIWITSLHPSPSQRNRTSDKLFVKWMQLNKNSQDGLIGFTPAATSRSPQVIEACFDWVRAGGLANEDMPFILAGLFSNAQTYHKALLPRLVQFVRKWLKANSDHKYAGRMHAALFYATRSKSDTIKAKQWYRQHQNDEYAWHVLSNLLDDAYWYGYKPDQYTVEQAKKLLRQEKFRHEKPRLVGALIGASADEESIAWAREIYRRLSPHAPLSILRRLLLRAPNRETIVAAEEA